MVQSLQLYVAGPSHRRTRRIRRRQKSNKRLTLAWRLDKRSYNVTPTHFLCFLYLNLRSSTHMPALEQPERLSRSPVGTSWWNCVLQFYINVNCTSKCHRKTDNTTKTTSYTPHEHQHYRNNALISLIMYEVTWPCWLCLNTCTLPLLYALK